MKIDKSKTVIVRGDGAFDWHIAAERSVEVPTRLQFEQWTGETHAQVVPDPGGVFLLARLIKSSGVSCDDFRTVSAWGQDTPSIDVTHTHSLWVPREKEVGKSKLIAKEKVWRMVAWFGHIKAKTHLGEWLLPPRPEIPMAPGTVLVIQDLGFGIMDHVEPWKKWLLQNEKHIDRVVYHLALQDAESLTKKETLARTVIEILKRKVIVTTSRDDLRRAKIRIGQTISIETSAEDIRDALEKDERLRFLCEAGVVVVAAPAMGAILADCEKSKYSLLFTPRTREKDFFGGHPGRVRGYAVCMTASLSLAAVKNGNLVDAAATGLRCMREIQIQGGGPAYDVNGQVSKPEFPLITVKSIIEEGQPYKLRDMDGSEKILFTVAEYPDGKESLLEDRFENGDLERKLFAIIERGPAAECLTDVPLLKLGETVSVVNRHEIESYLSVESMISEYLEDKDSTRPLCLAVFGPPGCGKSRGVKELARLTLRENVEHLEYNLSQFNNPEMLIGAFHQVRDGALTGVPLVLWDEFDSKLSEELGWLKYFLAPMQDGRFQEGKLTHHLGRSIFVFCGGTNHSMAQFRAKAENEDYRAAKARDFLSRIRGFVDISGPDGRDGEPPVAWQARRALTLHSLLKQHAPHIFEERSGKKSARIDEAVMRGFLRVGRFQNGVRSMESIVLLSALQGKREYLRSSLPVMSQLDLHVDAQEFLECTNE